MKAYTHPTYIRSDETLPVDILLDLPSDDDLASADKRVYNITDDNRTDVADDVVDAIGIFGDTVRVVMSGMTLGVTYDLVVEGESLAGQTYMDSRLVRCAKQSEQGKPIHFMGRESYLVDFEDRLPSEVEIDSVTVAAYTSTDNATDIGEALFAGYSIDERKVYVYIENAQVGETYILDITATSTVDSITNAAYTAVKTLVVTCKQL